MFVALHKGTPIMEITETELRASREYRRPRQHTISRRGQGPLFGQLNKKRTKALSQNWDQSHAKDPIGLCGFPLISSTYVDCEIPRHCYSVS